MSSIPMVEIKDLNVCFHQKKTNINAVNGVNLTVNKGEVVALLGESGSGKSVTLRALMRLHSEKTTTLSGSICIDGQEIIAMNNRQLQKLRGSKVAMIFQEPLLAFDPVYTIGQQITEAIRKHQGLSRKQSRDHALEALRSVHIPSPEERLDSFPHEMSGGMRQRAMIAQALACNPELLLADEPTTALDATVQIQILILLRNLQRKLGLSIIFVTHDIGAAIEVADRVAVMYGGKIVEQAPLAQLLKAPRHPYSQALLASRPAGGLKPGMTLASIQGSPPDLSNLPAGCAFAPRCVHASPICQQTIPITEQIDKQHSIDCHNWHNLITEA
ncbi:MAG: ABC transporter ATP-binding protein [Marinomonas sp.]